jgi:hypothetical protein
MPELTPEQLAAAAQSAAGGSGQQEDWEARYKGSVRKIEELTLANRTLLADQAAKASETEQLRAQLGVKDAEKTAAIGERDKQLQSAITTSTAKDTELAQLRAFKLKVEVAQELKNPSLIKIIGNLPDMTDKEALKSVMTDFANFANEAVKEREQQLMAGVTPPLGGGSVAKSTPTSQKAWENHINSLALGSPDRAQAMDDYGTWLEKNAK